MAPGGKLMSGTTKKVGTEEKTEVNGRTKRTDLRLMQTKEVKFKVRRKQKQSLVECNDL